VESPELYENTSKKHSPKSLGDKNPNFNTVRKNYRMKGTVNFLGDTTAPYLKSFSVNGLKHKVINCTYGGERGKTSIKSLSYLSLNKFILSANCSDAWRKREREASS